MTERKWEAVPPQTITANGGTDGQISVSDSSLFKVKQRVTLFSDSTSPIEYIVNKIPSPTLLLLGHVGKEIYKYANVSIFLTADNAKVSADEQNRPTITPHDFQRAAYDEEPAMAHRNILVDKYGRRVDTANPLPVRLSDGSVNIGTVNAEIETQLSSKDGAPDTGDVHDSVRIGDQNNEAEITANKELKTHDGEALAKLQQILEAVDGLEGFTDGLEGLLTTIRDNADQVEGLLSNIGNNTDQLESFTDGLEGLLTTTNTLLTTIRDNADQVEGLLTTLNLNTDTLETLITNTNTLLTAIGNNTDQLEGFTDGLEGLLTSTNSLLTTIRDNADTVESLLTSIGLNTDGIESLITTSNTLLTNIGNNTDQLEAFTDGLETLVGASNTLLTTIRDNADQVESLLTALGVNTDGLEGLITSSNSLLTAIGTNTDQLEGFVDGIEGLLTTIRDNADTVESLLTTIRDNADTVESLLTNLIAEVNSSNYTMNEAFDKAQAVAGQLDDVSTVVATEGNVAPARITPQRALHVNLRDQAGAEFGTASSGLSIKPGNDSVIISTTAALGVSGIFTSSIIDLTTITGSEITIGVFTNQASAANGLQIRWSHDGTNFDHIESYTIPITAAGSGKTFTQRKVSRYFQIIYTNGTIAQTIFRLYVSLNTLAAKASSHRIGSPLDDDNDAQLTKSIITAKDTITGLYQNIELGRQIPGRALPIIKSQGSNYSAAIPALVASTAATDIFTITGSATKVVRVTRVRIGGIATAATWAVFLGIKRSAANAGGTSTVLTAVPHDSTQAAATAVVRAYTANPTTLGTAVGTMRAQRLNMPMNIPTNAQGNGPGFPIMWDFGMEERPVILRGVAETFAINFNAATVAGNSISIFIEWEEE